MADENNKNDKTFTQPEVDAMIKKSVEEAAKKVTESFSQQIKDLTETNFSLEMNKSGLNLNKEQEEVLRDYAGKQNLTDNTAIVNLAKKLFNSSTASPASDKKTNPLKQEDLDAAFANEPDPDRLREDRF